MNHALAAAVALGIEPTHPGVIDAHPGHVLYDTATGQTWSCDPEDYRMHDGQPHDELRTAMELAVETAWLNEDGDPDTVRVLVPADLV